MFCPKCGEILRDSAVRCPVCGASLKKADTQINTACDCETNKRLTFPGTREKKSYAYPVQLGPCGEPSVATFLQLIRVFFRRSLDFGGRSSRWEFWWTQLFLLMAYLFIGGNLRLLVLWLVLTLVPSLALSVRRLHDLGKSGWWLLFALALPVGPLALLTVFCQPSTPDNRWGPVPEN